MYLSLKGSLGHTAITDRVGESLLQIAEGSSAAYSLRNLGSDSPSVVRVRRESDNAERDFTAQDINTSVVENWVNAQTTGNGFVETWYDQSGNGNNAVQLTASQQPKIVDAGNLVERTVSGVSSPSVKFTANNGMQHGLTSLSADGQQSLFFVSDNQLTGNVSTRLIEIMSNTVDEASRRRPLFFKDTNSSLVFSVDTLSGLYRTPSQSNFVSLYSSITEDSGGGTHTAYQDGSQFGSASVTLDANPNIDLNSRQFGNIAPDELGAFFFTEVIYYPSDESAKRAAIENNIDNHYGITSAGSYVNAAGDSYINAAGDTYLQP